MMARTQQTPRKRKISTATERPRKRIFCKCRELGLDDEARRLIAASCRKDHQETMQGMEVVELARMEHVLDNQLRQKRTNEQLKQETHRRERLRKRKRVDDDKSPFASERARHWLRNQAEAYWGDQWQIRLSRAFAKMIADTKIIPENALTTTINGQEITTVYWNDEKIPRRLHWDVTRAVEAMSGREMRNQK